MAGPLRTVTTRLHQRRCVSCGYDGSLLKDGRAPRCARCGCDLRSRPALTYAEMEGFVPRLRARPRRSDEARTIERWLAAIMIAAILVVAAAVLAARSLS